VTEFESDQLVLGDGAILVRVNFREQTFTQLVSSCIVSLCCYHVCLKLFECHIFAKINYQFNFWLSIKSLLFLISEQFWRHCPGQCLQPLGICLIICFYGSISLFSTWSLSIWSYGAKNRFVLIISNFIIDFFKVYSSSCSNFCFTWIVKLLQRCLCSRNGTVNKLI